jgi:CelD/BcsL family acetyltransferase involved in cellulose biosynthesis
MRAEVHDGPPSDLLEDWRRLFAADDRVTPFASPDWATCWWKHWGEAAKPWMVVVSDAGGVVGLAPLLWRREGPFRLLRPLGGRPGDYWDVLSAPELRSSVVGAAFDELANSTRFWDLLVLDDLSPYSQTAQVLVLRQELPMRQREPMRCPAIELPGSFDDYLRMLPSSHARTNFVRHLKRLDRGELELYEPTGAEELRDGIQRWHEIRMRQWQTAEKQLYSLQTTERFRDFFADVAASMVPAGLAALWEFRRDGERVGMYFSFLDHHAQYWNLGGYEPSFRNLGVGKVAIAHAVRSSIAAGRAMFDFTGGAEPYKYWYGARDQMSPSLLTAAPGVRGVAAMAVIRAVTKFRSLRD